MSCMDSMACNKGQQHVGKAKKKQVKDELDRLKQAEKKKRRLEKALATSAAIISELEKKKQKKKEEQQRLDEEGAAIAEAVALQVLLGEDSDDRCKVGINESGCKSWNNIEKLEVFMGGARACFGDADGGGTWSVSSENGEWSFRCEKNEHEEVGWGSAGFSVDYIAAQAVRSLQIAEDANEATILF